jgi:hypothetical protein
VQGKSRIIVITEDWVRLTLNKRVLMTVLMTVQIRLHLLAMTNLHV